MGYRLHGLLWLQRRRWSCLRRPSGDVLVDHDFGLCGGVGRHTLHIGALMKVRILTALLLIGVGLGFSCGALIWPPENGRHEAVSGGSPELPGIVVRRVVAQRRV